MELFIGFGLLMTHVGSKRRTDMNLGEIIFILPPQIVDRSVVRRMESVWRKIINADAAVSFNKICLEEGVLKYTDIYTLGLIDCSHIRG